MVGATMTLRFGYLVSRAVRLVGAGLGDVVAVDRVDELEALVLVLREGRLHQVDPGVLVGRRGRGRQDRDVAGAARGELAGPVGEVDADAAEVDLVDEDVIGADRRARVEADDLDARVLGGLERRRDGVLVVGRDDDRVDLLGGEVGDERDLQVGLGLGRSDLGHGRAELGRGLVDARLRGGEVLVDDVLRQVADGHPAGGRRPAADAPAEAGAALEPELEHAPNARTAMAMRAMVRPVARERTGGSSSISTTLLPHRGRASRPAVADLRGLDRWPTWPGERRKG